MLQRWKLILTNWINCYFNKSGDEEQNLNLESLATIISRLRENLNLDESKSSLLEAHTVEEFLSEKYPEFKFENGTVEPSNDEEVCLSASLLLFFVCVNSKNLDIKNVMCSKLKYDDQETILKFSKCLLECPVITVGEMRAAITEACGQDIAAMELPRQFTVAETPPAMRSMHNNIRRLQAELEAERFDRNYLQEELNRTNARLERLLKDKEHHKLEILNLKAKISLCCGEDGATKSAESSADASNKLTRQLHQLEMRLDDTLAQLHDVTYERDACQAKMDQLKNDRDKWLALSQQENARMSQLSEELETERRHNQSLKDLVAELRQHNRLNGFDTSSLECDDPDASLHSIQHNSSICSEACANVVEVQLGEERAKIVVLQQQIQTLQVHINELNEMREAEKSTLENVVSQKDSDICDLKHRINEEIEKKNNLKAHCDNEITKLNNEINELEQKLKDNTYLKTLVAESETKHLDVFKELEISKENAQQLSSQLKKIVHQKNEEIAELKKQVNKMSVTENRATQIIKVSAKYQAMILKRIAEIKSNTVLKELTNFGNSDNELRRSLNVGSVTMEDLENFLETTDRHLKRCAEKQIALQKDRDRLAEVNRINESEIINLKKFLTELSVSFQTFSSMKDLYVHKLSKVISVQRTVRREILSLDGRISDSSMCKLERGYGAVMQDLAECAMNLERWVERCISRTVSAEKIKQAFTSDTERTSLASPSFQNTGLEIQLQELEKSFQKLLEEIARAVKNEGATESQASTIMEVRAEYEDKLNRMKAKMKDLFNEQMALLKNKQRGEIELLERELQKTRSRMEDSRRAYESHIKELTKELWNVGEKYLVKNDEAEWLRRKQRSGSLMSLQHVHSSGLVPTQEVVSRPSDAHSLRSLPISDHHPKTKRDGRGLHMSDEEGEVFDNRCLKELATTPRREPPGQRLSELKWRNSLCPPHLKSSYPAETQFAPTIDEDDLKAGGSAVGAARAQRKEVGITAYKKPGPPTPSKQAGRLSATDAELRESIRVENDPHAQPDRKTSTPARFRAFLRLNKHDSSDGTPRTRRLSSIFRRK